MNLEFVQLKQQIVCCFMKDNGRIFEGPGFKGYVPILSDMSFETTTDIKMVHTKDVGESLESYDANNTSKKLTPAVRENKKIDVTTGDINVTPTQLLFNFTDFTVVCYNQHNIPITLPKLESKKLRDQYRGQLVLMTVHRLNNPKRVADVTGHDKNYLVDIIDRNKSRNRNNSRFSNFMDIVEEAQKCWEQLDYFSPEYNCNMITVVTVSTIPGELFNVKGRPGDQAEHHQSLILTEHDLLLTRDSVFQYKENPSLDRHIDVAEFKSKVINGSRFLFLVDKDNKLDDRYYYTHGTVEKLPKLAGSSVSKQPDGLYIGRYDDTLGVKIGNPIPLDEIDNLDYIFRTVEEATRGADKAEQWNQELKEREAKIRERELELKNISVTKRTEYETIIHDLRLENERVKQKAAQDAQEREQEFLNFKRNLEQSSMREKARYDSDGYSMKHYFDERKYERDDIKGERETFVETLKTVAATAGVIATGFMIYKQVTKAS